MELLSIVGTVNGVARRSCKSRKWRCRYTWRTVRLPISREGDRSELSPERVAVDDWFILSRETDRRSVSCFGWKMKGIEDHLVELCDRW